MKSKKKVFLLFIIMTTLMVLYVTWGVNVNNYRYFLSGRIPRVIAIALTGGAIAFSSLMFQTVTNNRILTPSVLGLDSLYILIQTIVVFFMGSGSVFILNKNLNFTTTLIMMILFSCILFSLLLKQNKNLMKLLLVGIVIGTLFSSLSSFLQMIIDPNEFMHLQDKLFASFSRINTQILTLSIILAGITTLFIIKDFNVWDVLSLGRDVAINLGVNYDKTIWKMLIAVSILVSVSTALVGPITFLGLMVVNLAREFLKTYKHKDLVIGSVLISIISLVGGQLIVERMLNFGTPISVIINFFGGMYFIYLLLKENIS